MLQAVDSRAIACSLVWALWVACGPSAGGQTGETPETPSMGPVECETDAECAHHLAALRDELASPAKSRRHHDDGVCGLGQIFRAGQTWGQGEPSCRCGDESSGILLSSTSPDPCLYTGRGHDCLYRTDEFPGCDIDAPDESCDEVCADFDARVEADAERVFEVDLHPVRCIDNGCHGVLRIEDACYPDGSAVAYDCTLGDSAILEAAAERERGDVIPSCDDPAAMSEPLGTCAEPPRDEAECRHERDPGEWEGAPVDTCLMIPCEDFCGARLACVDGICGPCERDEQCLPGEVCVLDQCIVEDKAECRSRHDCPEGILCLFVDERDTPAEPRGNLGTWAICNTQERLNEIIGQMGDAEAP